MPLLTPCIGTASTPKYLAAIYHSRRTAILGEAKVSAAVFRLSPNPQQRLPGRRNPPSIQGVVPPRLARHASVNSKSIARGIALHVLPMERAQRNPSPYATHVSPNPRILLPLLCPYSSPTAWAGLGSMRHATQQYQPPGGCQSECNCNHSRLARISLLLCSCKALTSLASRASHSRAYSLPYLRSRVHLTPHPWPHPLALGNGL
ncbi:hypothetical protein B0I35DRAFT_61449 [Stachybotrys elegans]|uniref:Uncharacterized protein n=1 Tax=Stachybotrys elegans TaxID=80388 RepID=A0A8K0WPE9_9HYPO|nr:hypothetical protein B0I35DRAFT_61449 [Stachybotrys elegans]